VVLLVSRTPKQFISLRILDNLRLLLLLPMWKFSQSLAAVVVESTMVVVEEQEDYYTLLAHL